jgi:hypothetical protein
MTRKYFGRNVVREKRKKDRWQEALLVSYFLAACRRGGLCCEKNDNVKTYYENGIIYSNIF